MPAAGAPLMTCSSRIDPLQEFGCERFFNNLKLANFINLV
jgi:hypothetical protein